MAVLLPEEIRWEIESFQKCRRKVVPTRICFFVSNNMLHDPRVSRHAETLGAAGHDVLVACPKTGETALNEKRRFYRIQRFDTAIFRMRTRFKGVAHTTTFARNAKQERTNHFGLRLVRYLVRAFTRYIANPLVMLHGFCSVGWVFNPDIYVSNDLDTLAAGVLASRVTHRPLIHDVHELFPDMYQGLRNHSAMGITWLRVLEHLLIRYASVVITVNELIGETLRKRYGIRQPEVILNIPCFEK